MRTGSWPARGSDGDSTVETHSVGLIRCAEVGGTNSDRSAIWRIVATPLNRLIESFWPKKQLTNLCPRALELYSVISALWWICLSYRCSFVSVIFSCVFMWYIIFFKSIFVVIFVVNRENL